MSVNRGDFMESKSRDPALDALRGMAIVSVLMIHITADYINAPPDSLTYGLFNVVNQCFHWAVPVFVALTVYLGLKSGRRLGPMYVIKKAAPIAAVYFIWSAVYIGFRAVLYSAPLPDARTLISDILQGGACYHLYYMVMLVQLYVVIALLSWLPIKKLRPRIWFLPGAIGIQILVLVGFVKLVMEGLGFYNSAILPIFYILPITFGVMLAADSERTRRFFSDFGPLLGVCWGFGIAAMAWYSAKGAVSFNGGTLARPIFNIVMTNLCNLGGIPLMFMLAEKLKGIELLRLLGQHSLAVYLAHPLVLMFIDRYWSPNPILGMAVKTAALLGLSVIYVKCNTLFIKLRQS